MQMPSGIQYQRLFESVPGLYLILLPDLTIVAVSDAYLKATMTRREEILGRRLFDVFPDNPNDPAATGVSNLRASLNYVLQNGTAHTMAVQKYDIRRPDGSFEVRYWSPLNKPVFDDNNKILYIIHRVEDVTEFVALKSQQEKNFQITEELRNKVEQMEMDIYLRAHEIQNREKLFQTIFTGGPDAVIVIDQEGKVIKWNAMAEKVFGWKASEITGKLLSDTIIPPRYREAHAKGLERFLKTGEGPVIGNTIEIQAINKDQKEFDVALSISPIRINDQFHFIGFVRDITERKKTEEQIIESNKKFRGLLESAPDATIIADKEGKIVLINRQTEILFGYKRDELIGQPVEMLIPFDLRKKHGEHRESYYKEPKFRSMGAGLELFAIRRDGSKFPVEISLSPLQTPEGLLVSAAIRDITERKKIEAEIISTNNKFKGLLESAPDATIIADNEGKIVLINQQTEILFGYSRDELINQPVEMLIPYDLRNKHGEHRAGYYKEPKFRSMGAGLELYAIRRDGSKFPVEISLSPLQTPEGLLVSAAIRDITERKKIEAEIIATNNKFKGLLESAPDATIIADHEGKIVLINRQTEILFGYNRDELIGQPVEFLIPHDRRQKHSEHRAGYYKEPKFRSMGAGLELYAIRRDGSKFPVEISLSPLQTPEGLLVSAAIRDITERKNTETIIQKQKQEVQDLINSMSTLVAKVGLDGRLLVVNKTALTATGLSIEELLQMNFLHGSWWTFDPEVHKRVCDAFEKACSGIPINYDENIFVFGQVITINFSLIPIFASNNKVEYIVAEGRDITSLKQLSAELQTQSDQLAKANKELEAFSYSVSHDLRAPLRIIDGYTEIMTSDYESKLDDEGKRILGIIKANARRMGLLIDDLLNFSRLGRKELNMTKVDMNRLIQPIITEIASGNNVSIHVSSLEPAQGDNNLLRQVWSNLISNAVKYSAGNPNPTIEINCRKEGNEIIYSIKDNGVGFNMKYADKLFGVFQRLHKANEFEGTGVGLALVQRIINRHGGRVWAEAEVNKGATFYFSLPTTVSTQSQNKLVHQINATI